MKVSKNILLIDYIISAADTDKLKPNVVLSLIEVCFSDLDKEEKKGLSKDILTTLGMTNPAAKMMIM